MPSKYKSRGLIELERSFAGLRAEIERRLSTGARLRILEVGCGHGQAMLDLCLLYGDRVEIHGINLRPKDGSVDSMVRAAEKIGGRPLDNIDRAVLPVFHHFDVCGDWPLPESSFDIVYSQHAFLHFPDKIRALEGINAVLKNDGIAFVDLQIHRRGAVRKNSIIIIEDGRTIPFSDHARRFDHLDVAPRERSMTGKLQSFMRRFSGRPSLPRERRPALKIRKALELDYNLEFIESRPFSEITPGRIGRQSVYRFRKQPHGAMAPIGTRLSAALVFPRWRLALATFFGLGALAGAAMQLFSEEPFRADPGPAWIQAAMLLGLGWQSLSLSHFHAKSDTLKRVWAAAAFCMFGLTLTKIGAILPSARMREVSDYSSFAVWSLAGLALIAISSLERLPAIAVRMLCLGFVLQTSALAADLSEDVALRIPHFTAAIANVTQGYFEVLCLLAYFAGLTLLRRSAPQLSRNGNGRPLSS